MLFVPLPLFATAIVVFVLMRFVGTRDMAIRAHQLLAGLIAAYAVQSLFLCLRWGYGMENFAIATALLAPLLPALAYLAYRSLSGSLKSSIGWIATVVVGNWLALTLTRDIADVFLLATYLGLGMLLVRQTSRGTDQFAVSPIGETADIRKAMLLIGVALVASAMTDLYVIYDFVQHGGRNIGLFVTFVQTAFILIIAYAATFGRAAISADIDDGESLSAVSVQSVATPQDTEIVERLERAMQIDALFKDEDLSLRKLARKLGLSERDISQAINRSKGINVSKFVNGYRIEKACDLIRSTNRSLLEISLAVGFGTKSNFNREFARVTGSSPSDWRREIEQETEARS